MAQREYFLQIVTMDNKIIYQLIEEDAQTVAEEVINRRLTSKELDLVKDTIEKKIKWYELMEYAIYEITDPDEVVEGD